MFTAALRRHLDDEGYRALQTALVLRPDQGAIVSGGAGVRKMRWRLRDEGKRGGLRVIYYWQPETGTLYMLYLYRKNQQGDLTRVQIQTVARLVRETFK